MDYLAINSSYLMSVYRTLTLFQQMLKIGGVKSHISTSSNYRNLLNQSVIGKSHTLSIEGQEYTKADEILSCLPSLYPCPYGYMQRYGHLLDLKFHGDDNTVPSNLIPYLRSDNVQSSCHYFRNYTTPENAEIADTLLAQIYSAAYSCGFRETRIGSTIVLTNDSIFLVVVNDPANLTMPKLERLKMFE